MLCAAFFPRHAALLFWGVWLFGWLLAFVLGFVFRKTLFRGEDSPFVMELPPYRLPTLRGIAQHMWQRSWSYVKKAGTFILASSVLVWALLTYPKVGQWSQDYDGRLEAVGQASMQALAAPDLTAEARAGIEAKRDRDTHAIENERRMEAAKHSIAGRVGVALEPVTRAAGFDWKLNVALFAGIAAKEVIVSTMGIVYGVGEADPDSEADGDSPAPLRQRLSSDPAYSPAGALALMIFVMVYVPCIATLAVTRKELGSIKWPVFMAGFTLVVAFVLAVLVYQVGRLIV